MDSQEIKKACLVCCPMCDKDKCVGRLNCDEIKRYIEKQREKEK